MNKNKLKSAAELADHFGVTSTTIRNWFSSGLKHESKYIVGRKAFKVSTIKKVEKYLKDKGVEL